MDFWSAKSQQGQNARRERAEGYLELEWARVNWFLSINYEHVPGQARKAGKRTFRTLTIENQELEFSEGFTDLHTVSYQHILDGKGGWD